MGKTGKDQQGGNTPVFKAIYVHNTAHTKVLKLECILMTSNN